MKSTVNVDLNGLQVACLVVGAVVIISLSVELVGKAVEVISEHLPRKYRAHATMTDGTTREFVGSRKEIEKWIKEMEAA